MNSIRTLPRTLLLMLALVLAPLAFPTYGFDLDKLKSKLDRLKQKTETLKEKKKVVDLATGKVSREHEVEIGRNVMSGLLGAAPLVANPTLQQYVNKVGRWIAMQSGRPDLPWTFGVIDSPNVNAFAAPGGYIVLTVGLYQLFENESQLAGVLAHEISHVIERHHLDALRKTSQGNLLGELAVRATDKDYRDRMRKLVNSGVQIYARGLDQRYEFGADRMGVVFAARAGYDPYALLDVLATLHSINRNDDAMAVFLNTHPPLDERIDTLVSVMDRHMPKLVVQAENQRLQATNRRVAQGLAQ